MNLFIPSRLPAKSLVPPGYLRVLLPSLIERSKTFWGCNKIALGSQGTDGKEMGSGAPGKQVLLQKASSGASRQQSYAAVLSFQVCTGAETVSR